MSQTQSYTQQNVLPLQEVYPPGHPYSFLMASGGHTALQFSEMSVAQLANELLDFIVSLWWQCGSEKPAWESKYSTKQQAEHGNYMGKLIDGLLDELKRPPKTAVEAEALKERITKVALPFLNTTLGIEPRHLELILSHRLFDVLAQFAQEARQFDPLINDDDVYQAGRNVMTMSFLQILFDLPVRLTPAVFAYSMLYPYTDNYLDDPAIHPEIKRSFISRFRDRLAGKTVAPLNAHEGAIDRLVAMIEGQFDRQQYPQVYESLLVIHDAQVKSMVTLRPNASPYEFDVLRISFEKGGASVLADGYLVAGALTPEQAMFTFAYGSFTQLMDDLEDIHGDIKDGQMTIFSQTARSWPLGAITNRTFEFGHRAFGLMKGVITPGTADLYDLLDRSIDPFLIDMAGKAGQYYTRNYMQEIEGHFPFSFKNLKQQRDKLQRHRTSIVRIIKLLGGAMAD